MPGSDRATGDLMALFEERGAFLKGHFLLSSGYHSSHYFQCALLFQDPALGARLGVLVAGLFPGAKVQAVLGPAIGGILLAYEVARAFEVRALFAERDLSSGKMSLRRGLHLARGNQVLLVEDVLTTGESIREVLDLVGEAGAVPVGIGALVDRSGGTLEFPCPSRALLSVPVARYRPEECPLCHEGIPMVKPGSRPSPTTG